MFIGHYGVAFAARSFERRVPLWAYFLAVQWVDLLWCVLVYLGVERVHVEPGVNPSSPLVFDYYPYTHSLLAGILWGAAACGLYVLIAREGGSRRAGVVLGLAVLSHWLLDFLVHLPDLDLVSESYKVGLGLWRYPVTETAVEFALAIAGLAVYFRSTPGLSLRRRMALVALCVTIAVVQLAGAFGPPPPSVKAMAVAGLALYLIFAALARAAEGPLESPGREPQSTTSL
jgi:hypothetical protein